MKLAEIKGDRAVEVLAGLIAPVTKLSEDKEVRSLFSVEGIKPNEDGTVDEAKVAKKIQSNFKVKLPKLIKFHKTELFTILALLNNRTYADYSKNVSLMDLIMNVNELLDDADVKALFMPAEQVTEKK